MTIAPSLLARPEHQLLLACASARLLPPQTEHVQALLRQEINWPYLVQFAIHHALAPLLYHHLRVIGAELAPPALLEHLQTYYGASLRRNLTLLGALRALAALFTSAGIETLTYKGLALAEAAYGNIAFRPIADIDILVRPQDLPTARRLLLQNGYTEARRVPPSLRPIYEAVNYEETFQPQHGDGMVELHWTILPPHHLITLTFDHLWPRRVPSSLAPNVVTPGREDTLMVLCAHGLKHHWDRLEHIAAVADLIRTSPAPLDWPYLRALAETSGGARGLRLGLALALDLAEAVRAPLPLPRDILAYIHADPILDTLRAQVWQTLFAPNTPNPQTNTRQKYLFQLRTKEGVANQLRYALRLGRLFATPCVDDFALAPQSESAPAAVALPLYTALRARRLLQKYLSIATSPR